MTTIKEHLEGIRTKLERHGLHVGDQFGEQECGEVETAWLEIMSHLAAIEAKLDAPMKTVEEYMEHGICFDCEDGTYGSLEDFIRAIQADAIASKLPAVDLRALAEETDEQLMDNCLFAPD